MYLIANAEPNDSEEEFLVEVVIVYEMSFALVGALHPLRAFRQQTTILETGD